MAEYTQNYNLEKQQSNEFVDIGGINGNFDIIDTEIKTAQDKIQNVTMREDGKPAFEYLTVGSRKSGSVLGTNSSSSGINNTASGKYSHSEGYNNISSGDAAHTEGSRNITVDINSHAEGDSNQAGRNSHAEGMLTFAGQGDLHTITAFNNTSKTLTLDNVNGLVIGDILQIKLNAVPSVALFYNIQISAINGLVITLNTTVTIDATWIHAIKLTEGFPTHAEGGLTIANGKYSHAEGYSTVSSGQTSHAEGSGTKASGRNSHTEGEATKANNLDSHAEGRETIANGGYSHAEGYLCKAYSTNSHAEGYNTQAGASSTDPTQGESAHAEGTQNVAKGTASHAEGSACSALGDYSHAEGHGCNAPAIRSHAEGYATNANGDASHAQGWQTQANGYRSFAGGFGTIANGAEQAVFGRYNVADASSLLIIGNGTSEVARSNALMINPYGTLFPAGHMYGPISSVNITMASGFTATEPCATDRTGHHVELQIYASGTIPANTWVTIGTIPNAVDRPFRTIRVPCTGSDLNTIGGLAVQPNGVIIAMFTVAQTSIAGHVSYLSNVTP